MYFFALAEMRSILATTRKNGKNPLQSWDNLLAGAAARGSVGFIMMPITVVKIRYEVSLVFPMHEGMQSAL
jgi:solute carrier family 25 protein 38